ncbi:hypothetical protein Tco_0864502 [Tanacetum coccineum]
MAQIIQCLCGKTRGLDQMTNKDAIILYSLVNGVNIDYAKQIWEDIVTKLKKKNRKKVVPYTRFLSLLMEHKMKGYGNDNVTLNPTQVFNVHNWALKKNQPEGPAFTDQILAICNADVSVEHKAPYTSSYRTNGGFLKHHLDPKTGHLHKGKQSQFTMDTNPSQPSVFTPVVAEMHKEDQQGTTRPASLGVSEQTKSASEGLETVLAKPTTGKGASTLNNKLRKTLTLILISSAQMMQRKISS